ncbi:MAG TPA: multicopper oxidase domain-containing protein [Stellaceae bacterium]|nr:multicopper oxidase domain-containing protein [Stellaceae bacterium]
MPTRRELLMSALAATAIGPATALAAAEAAPSATVLRLDKRVIEVNGKPASVYAIRQPDGISGITTRVGDRFRVRVENRIDKPSLVHWHGLAPPWRQDGVPGISGPPIAPGGSADYDFPLAYGGTFWMHSHQGFQEQLLMSAPLIIRDQRDRPGRQEIVLMLEDFSFTPPAEIFANLKKGGSMPGMAASGAGLTPAGAKSTGGMPGVNRMAGMGQSSATGEASAAIAPDLNDVTYDAFLANGRTLADPEIVAVEPGREVLLRVINASSMSSYHFDLGRLDGRLIAVDGTLVQPIIGRRFPIAVAQRLDIVLVIPRDTAAYPLLATVEGERSRTGIVLAAGKPPITRLATEAPAPTPAIMMALESRLRAVAPLAPRKPDRIHNIDLTGEMSKYIWSINGVAWNPEVPPLPIAKGERVALVMTNSTGMPHPMHLHGHRFQVVAIDGLRFPGAVRDTVRVPPAGRVVIEFDADNPGWWAFHCHMLYHMEAGMFTTLRYV